MKAKIFKQPELVAQYGQSKSKKWVLEFYTTSRDKIDPITGWTGSNDMNQELILQFTSLEQAINYAQNRNIEFELIQPKQHVVKPKSYSDNFK